MLRLSVVGRALLLALGLLLTSGLTSAADSKETPDESHLLGLVYRLGDDAFETREEASRELAVYGRKALKALEEGAKSVDAEIVRRCGDLIVKANRSDLETALDAFLESRDEKVLLKVPAWPKFQKAVGNSANARNLFVMICTTDGAMLDAAETNVQKASQMYTQRVQLIQNRMNQPWAGNRPPEYATIGELAALLYVGMDSRIQPAQNLQWVVYSLLHQQEPQRLLKADPMVRKLFAAYIEGRTDANMIQNHLQLVQQLEIRESLDWVAKQVENKAQQPYVRSQALGAYAKLGGKEVLPKLEAFFADTTLLQNQQIPPNVMIRTEVRDVALAMAVMASGQDIMPYNFPWLTWQNQQNPQNLQQNPNMPYQVAQVLGFADAKQRDAAFQRFADWKAKQPKK